MMPDFASLGSLVVFALVFLGVIAIGLKMLKPAKGKRAFRPRRNDRPDLRVIAKPGEDEALAGAAEQLRRVMAADFTARPLLNRPEAQLFEALDKAVIARNPK